MKENKNPILLVAGWVGTPNHFSVLESRLKIDGYQVFMLNLAPHSIGGLEKAAEDVQHTIENIKLKTSQPFIDLITHGAAGLVGRYYIKFMGGINSIKRCITLGCPHYGTTVMFLVDDLNSITPDSGFLNSLNLPDEITGSVQYTSIWSTEDEIIRPVENARLKTESVYIQNRKIENINHLALLTNVNAYKYVKESLQSQK
ncbi:MAG: esterase/lipase family protein [Candidatus Helarchaeota archaeon]